MFIRFWQVLLAAVVVSAATPTRSVNRRQNAPSPKFVSTSDGHFSVNGAPLNFVGTNAYWLPTLNSDDDIDKTLASIAAAGVKVVRTWAFNDVETVPQNGTWFQLISNGTTSVNEGANGLKKLDTVLSLAEKHNLYVMLTLTNNWNPRPLLEGKNVTSRDITPGTGNQLPRNTLSNDYGGMDVYVRTFSDPLHDNFYTNQNILDKFLNYTTQVVKRYVNSPAVFAWELANDPRCNSTLPSTNGCTPQTITRWHATVAAHIKSVDPNHLVSSGNQGFLCVDCPKLFPPVTPPPPQTSASPGRRRAIKPLTKRGILEERRLSLKKSRELRKRDGVSGGISIRGRWTSTETRRQTGVNLGPSFDGSHGVDSQDILNIPDIGFGSAQLFPDQATYGPDDPNLSSFDNIVQQGNQWIQQQAAVGKLLGKPVSMNAFGLVTQSNAPAYVPFNSTQAPFAPDSGTPTASAPYGVTDQQRDQAYTTWLQTGLQSGLSGMIQYQWSQSGLTPSVGTNIVPATGGTTTTPVVPGTGVSPNDGYGIQGQGEDGAVQTIQQASQQFAQD
ncbi:glycoside hydrolase superfamily [Crepidotus variabilis]|uniref:mannan endo-1,4-beta-mannosidase n=1 Tax=Crepidotus variabilis TaxID=179855 RepID=A0A9P6ENA5_9AGAR|nr:glycoside hydrolase superfamily [Crepidotus variabilis]